MNLIELPVTALKAGQLFKWSTKERKFRSFTTLVPLGSGGSGKRIAEAPDDPRAGTHLLAFNNMGKCGVRAVDDDLSVYVIVDHRQDSAILQLENDNLKQ